MNYTDATGDSSVSGIPSQQSSSTTSTSVTLSSAVPIRTGYTFAGWCYGTVNTTGTHPGTTCSGTPGTTHAASSSLAFIDQTATGSSANTITLQALWTVKTYTIALNANGGSGGSSSTTVGYKDTTLGTITNPTKSNTTNTRTISGLAANGTNASGATVTFQSSGNCTSTSNCKSTSTTTYTLNGWYKEQGATNKIASNATIPALQASTTYTNSSSQWTYTTASAVTLYAGWSSSTGSYSSVNLPTITKSGYTCGWATSSTATTWDYISGDTITPNGNITLYGTCTPNKYNITIKTVTGISSVSLNGTSCSSTSGCTVSNLTYGQSYTLTATAATGYNFSSWNAGSYGSIANTSSASTTYTVGAGASTITPSATAANYNITIKTATGIQSVVVRNTNNQSTVCSTTSTTGTACSLTYGTTYRINANAAMGYTFSSWSNSASLGTLGSTTSAHTSYIPGAGATTLTPSASAKTYTVTLKTNTGISSVSLKNSGGTTICTATNTTGTSCSVTYGQSYTIVASMSTGYNFSSWGSNDIVQYSHTPNVNDAGTSSGGYGDYLDMNQVISIPGASSLNITLAYETESTSYDWASFWSGSYPTYSAYNNYSTGIVVSGTGSAGGKYGDDSWNSIIYDLNNTTATFGFRSDSSESDYYGYRATVRGTTSSNFGSTTSSSTTYAIYGDTTVQPNAATVKSYTITLNGNGGTLGSTSTTVRYGNTTLGAITNPSRANTTVSRTLSGFTAGTNASGASISSTSTLTSSATVSYTFNGWYKESSATNKIASNATTPALQASTTYTDPSGRWTYDSGSTLYAGWSSSTGSYSSVTMPTITKTGHTCGWATSSTSTSWKYTSGQTNVVPDSSTTLYGTCVANTYSLAITFAGTGVSSVQVRTASGTGGTLKGTVSTSGGSVSGLTYNTAYYLYPTFTNGYELNSWAKTSTTGTLSSTTASNPTFTMGAGNGAVTITGKATPVYMQNWAGCSAATEGVGITLTDSRDGQTYTVAKLKDGNCWMVDNLNLGSSSLSVDLTSSNTNLSTTVTAATFNGWIKTTSTFISSYTAGSLAPISGTDSGSGSKYGAIYNYCAATAGTFCSSSTSGDATSDLCPAGWRLPYGYARDSHVNEFSQLATAYGGSESTGAKNMHNSLANGGAAFNFAGYYYYSTSSYTNQGSQGYYWSSSRNSSEGATLKRILRITSSSTIYPGSTTSNSRNGNSIRCIKK
ncbi:MAG: FISUMP domain-containing protein [Candidatus Saccharibacteria bacterium]|nr:FISUMP domain-containing protein [Candidatus Saccharibacteria bacterium]